jgi:Uma2 family endonuclease
MSPLTVKLDSFQLSDEKFYQLCQDNRDLRFERNDQGDLVIMPPTGGETGSINAKITVKLGIWAEKNGSGVFFDSSTGFTLPNGAARSPDAAWIPWEKWNPLTPKQREGFVPLCPDFVIELRSKSDSLKSLQAKMEEYIENGTRLGWLINRQDRKVEIYRPDKIVEVLDNPLNLSGEDAKILLITISPCNRISGLRSMPKG